jgi:hypothetical protein
VQASFNCLDSQELSGFTDVYSAVRALRGSWLTSRRGTTQPVRVFIDGALTRSVESLASLQSGEVLEVRYLSATEATARYGGAMMGGAIVVTTRR